MQIDQLDSECEQDLKICHSQRLMLSEVTASLKRQFNH